MYNVKTVHNNCSLTCQPEQNNEDAVFYSLHTMYVQKQLTEQSPNKLITANSHLVCKLEQL